MSTGTVGVGSMRLSDAIRRNLFEVCKALLNFKTLAELDRYYKEHEVYRVGPIFFDMAQDALFNDTFDHLIKVLDDNKDSATFWSIKNDLGTTMRSFPAYSEAKIDFLKNLWVKLKPIRNKTHFHIDLEFVGKHEEVWHAVKIKGPELKIGLEYLLEILNDAYRGQCGADFEHYASVKKYDASEVQKILEASGTVGVLDIRALV